MDLSSGWTLPIATHELVCLPSATAKNSESPSCYCTIYIEGRGGGVDTVS